MDIEIIPTLNNTGLKRGMLTVNFKNGGSINMHGFIRNFEIYSPGLSENDFKNMVNKNYI